jgi:hypothetical protein
MMLFPSHNHEAFQKKKKKRQIQEQEEGDSLSFNVFSAPFDSCNPILQIVTVDILDDVVPPAAASPPRPRVAAPAAVTASPDGLLPDDLLGVMLVQEQRQDERNEEENGIHDPECPRRLEHPAALVDVCHPWRIDAGTVGRKRAVVSVTELVIGGDEGADEAEVDESDKAGIAAGRAEAEECVNSPGAGEDGDDEEDQNVRGRELIDGVVAVNEPRLRVNGLASAKISNGRESRHTSMPMTGMRVMISARRQKPKRNPPSILNWDCLYKAPCKCELRSLYDAPPGSTSIFGCCSISSVYRCDT